MKRMISLLVILAILTGCSSTQQSVANSAEGEKVEIEFWYGLGSEAHKKMQDMIATYNQSQNKYVVKGVSQASYDETYQKLQASLASGNAPAVFITGDNVISDLGRKGVLMNLSPVIESDSNFQAEDFLDVFITHAKVNDQWFGIPAYGTTQVMYYRKDLYEAAGVNPEEAFSSWENLAKASKQLQEKTDVTFGHLPMWGSGNLVDVALSSGGDLVNEEGTEVMIDQPEWIDSWNFIRRQIHEEKTMKVNSGGQGWEYWYRTIDEVMNGSAASYTGSSGDKGDLDFSKIASIKQPGFNNQEARPVVDALYMAIPEMTSDEQKEAAYDFIRYFTNPEPNAEWVQAIGYIPVRESATEVPNYKKFLEENPHYNVPFEQAQNGSIKYLDPTGGKIYDALAIAADKVELQNIDAAVALKEAKQEAQKALEQVK